MREKEDRPDEILNEDGSEIEWLKEVRNRRETTRVGY